MSIKIELPEKKGELDAYLSQPGVNDLTSKEIYEYCRDNGFIRGVQFKNS